jgi:hypothetical protein
MSYRLSQLSPQASTHGSSLRVVVANTRSTQPEKFGDMEFWRSWIEYDSQAKPRSESRVNWNALLGLALTVGISASFWTGAAVLVTQVWK